MANSPYKQYLGDSVYADFDGYGVVLTTENGGDFVSNRIILEPNVVQAFTNYDKWLRDTLTAEVKAKT